MKKKMKTIILLILIIGIVVGVIFTSNNKSYAAPDGTWQSSECSVDLGGYINSGGNSWMTSYWNTYCLQHGTALRDNMSHYIKYKVEIRGNTATFYNPNKSVKGTVVTEENNVLAAILTPNDYIPYSVLQQSSRVHYDWWSIGMYVDHSHAVHPTKTYEDYSRAQLALYSYLGKWSSACSSKGVSPGWSYGASGIGDYSEAEAGVWFCEDLARAGTFNVDLYYLEAGSYQNLLVANPYRATEGKPVETTSVSVKKVWNGDNNNAYYNRKPITVQLKANGAVKQTQTLNDSNGWSYTFRDLPTNVTYTVSEVSVPGYTTNITGNAQSGFTITNTLQRTSVTVRKTWNDENNRDGKRPSSVKITLYENGVATSTTATLSASNGWTYTFSNLPKYKNGSQVNYTIQETVPTGYTATYSGNGTTNVSITNTHIPEKTQVTVTKTWEDAYNGVENFDEIRPSSITMTLYGNGVKVTKDGFGNAITNPITISGTSKNWTGTFTNLYKYENGKEIVYTVKESGIPEGYQSTVSGNTTVVNTHIPHYDGYIEISGKAWLDGEGGKQNSINGTFDKDTDPNSTDQGLSNIKVTLKDESGNTIKSTYTDENGNFTRSDYGYTDANGNYTIRVNYDNSVNAYKLYEDAATIEAKIKTAYVEFEYDGMLYTTVANADSGENTSKAIENETTRNTFDNNHSVVNSETNPNSWSDRNITASTKGVIEFDDTYKHITNGTSKENIKYCDGNGNYVRTQYNDSTKVTTGKHTCTNCEGTGHSKEEWQYEVDVIKIQNVNIGLFKREQPDVAIFSDLTKVEVEMNNQKYTYLYGVRGTEQNNVGLQTKFQNKDTYTYRRPVNPADIAYIQEESNSDKMKVKVTYEVKVANLSSTLVTTIHSISNYFDSEYTMLNSSGWKITEEDGFNEEDKFYKAIYNGDLDITVNPGKEVLAAELTYSVSLDAIKGLLEEEATLNNAVEIESYSTVYGEDTLYAEQRPKITDGNRTGKPYAGYDYDSHPGNANIQLKDGEDGIKRLYSTDQNGNIIPTDKMEDDTDIAPSFALCKDEPKTLAGTVWEDLDESGNGDERLGNGKIDDREKNVENVRVELYNLNGERAKLYDNSTKLLNKDAIVYTEPDGSYKLEGVVTGEYYLKFSYGDDTTKLQHEATTMDGGTTKVNARNYKSTIITDDIIKNVLKKDYENFSEEEKKWHITHNDGYSVAVDDMKERVKIPDLQYSNFNEHYVEPQNMTSYTKPFKTQVEFETTGTSKVETTQEEKDQKDILGNIATDNVLSKLDFGISERPRENLYTQKTISYIKLKLANGQVITEGDPRTEDLSYVKAMGFGQVIDSAVAARNAIEKQLLIELDSELIQGARLEIQYEVIVKNDNEIDYDYGNEENYSDINDNNHITKSSKANYYFYGDHRDLEEMKASIEFVDYLDSEVSYNEESNTDWTSPKNISDLKINGLVSQEVVSFIESNKYKVLQSNIEGAFDGKVTLGRGESSEAVKMSVNKLLTSQSENVYDNGAEIIKIDGKTARTIQESDEGVQIEKEYKPGNYIPSAESEKLEQDDDRVKVIITPPTGTTKYVATYIVTILAGLIVIITGIVFIKKKILTK